MKTLKNILMQLVILNKNIAELKGLLQSVVSDSPRNNGRCIKIKSWND